MSPKEISKKLETPFCVKYYFCEELARRFNMDMGWHYDKKGYYYKIYHQKYLDYNIETFTNWVLAINDKIEDKTISIDDKANNELVTIKNNGSNKDGLSKSYEEDKRDVLIWNLRHINTWIKHLKGEEDRKAIKELTIKAKRSENDFLETALRTSGLKSNEIIDLVSFSKEMSDKDRKSTSRKNSNGSKEGQNISRKKYLDR